MNLQEVLSSMYGFMPPEQQIALANGGQAGQLPLMARGPAAAVPMSQGQPPGALPMLVGAALPQIGGGQAGQPSAPSAGAAPSVPAIGRAAAPVPGNMAQVRQSTPSSANPSTPQAQVLAQLRGMPGGGTGMGNAAVNAINLAKGKSRWGAVASGLAAGMKGQDDANNAARKAALDNLLLQRSFAGEDRKLGQTDRRNDIMEKYYTGSLDARNQQTAARERASTTNKRALDPLQRARMIELSRRDAAARIARENGGQYPTEAQSESRKKAMAAWEADQPWNRPGGAQEQPPAAAAAPAMPKPKPIAPPEAGGTMDWNGAKWKFKGGNPGDPSAWEKI